MTLSKRSAFRLFLAGQLLACLLTASGPARASESDSATVLGMGGAGTANPRDGNAARRSPAAMLLLVGYTARVDGRYGQGLGVGGVLQDSRTSSMGGALAYDRQWVSQEPDSADLPGWVLPDEGAIVDQRVEDAYRLSLGYGFFQQSVVSTGGAYEIRRLALGLSGIYERQTSSLLGIEQGFDLDASVAGRPTNTLVLAATAHDLLPTGLRDPSAELGLWWEPIEPLAFALDGEYNPAFGELPLGARAGLQYVLSGVVPLRAGYALEGADQHLGLGLGIRNDSASIDYAFTLHTRGPDAGTLGHSLGLTAAF